MTDIAFYDAIPIDRLDEYGPIIRCSRFRPHTKVGGDVALTTWSRVPDSGIPIISTRDTAVHLRHIKRSPIYQAPAWAGPQVAENTLAAIREHGDKRRVVAVVGIGRIGHAVATTLEEEGWKVARVHHNEELPRNPGTVTIHLADHPDSRRWLTPDPAWKRVLLINLSRPWMVDEPAVAAAITAGQVGRYHVDGGPAWFDQHGLPDPQVEWTPHIAWDGEIARALRPRSIKLALDAARSGKLDSRLPLADPHTYD
jgi:lactate dehydrogenase-like 2-hydroxyacid dehydrogenase